MKTRSDAPVPLVIVSVLKPVDDVRMYRKFARSLARTRRYGVNILGFRSKANPRDPAICFHPVFDFSRLSWRRLTANYVAYRRLKKIAPQLIILTTPELFPAVEWYRRRFGATLVYDMVENYRRNLRYNRGFPAWLRVPLAAFVARLEQHLLKSSDLLLLAERGYLREVRFPTSVPRHTIENKVLRPKDLPSRPAFGWAAPRWAALRDRPLSLIYTGTVSEVYGIWSVLLLVRALVEEANLSAQLTVLGHVPQPELHRRLHRFAAQHAWLDLQTSDRPVPHAEILALIQRADVGMVSHQPVPSIEHCFPTRIWEYMAYRLPFLLQDHPYWTDYCAPWQCALPLDFNAPDVEEIKRQLLETEFYPRGVPEDIYWEGEGRKLVEELKNVRLSKRF